MVSFLLHLYQPSFQEPTVLKKVTDTCYIPLIKLLKQRRDFNITLNIPLSLLELFENNGYQSLIEDLSTLVARNQVELIGTSSYHALLPRLNTTYMEKQIIMQEYGLGYYFGRHTGFEGEKSILIKDLNGFFPPELAVNDTLLGVLDSLGYTWVLADPSAVEGTKTTSGFYKTKYKNLALVVRDRELSNILAFKRDADISNITNNFSEDRNIIIALDGETFGHHNTLGVTLLSNLYDFLTESDIKLMTVSDAVSNSIIKNTVSVVESSWGGTDEEVRNNPYPIWDIKDNTLQQLLWELLNTVQNINLSYESNLLHDEFNNINIWDVKSIDKNINELNVKRSLLTLALILKSQNSDQFWWASGYKLHTGDTLYSKNMLEGSLYTYNMLSNVLEDTKTAASISQLIDKITRLINN